MLLLSFKYIFLQKYFCSRLVELVGWLFGRNVVIMSPVRSWMV